MPTQQNIAFDQDLLDLFSRMIDDRTEKLILQALFANSDVEQILEELVQNLEFGKDD